MEIQQLRYFMAVAETGSFTQGAKRCHVSQPSLSQQIKKLEQQFGQPLFHRLGRRATLTDSGRFLLKRASSILKTVDDTEEQLRESGGLSSGRLVIGAIPTVAPYLLPPVLKRFTRSFPQVELSVHEDVTEQLVSATLAGERDLALAALPIDDERLHVERLLTEPLLLALPRKHRLAGKRRITLSDIRKERFIVLTEMHCLGKQTLEFCRRHDFVPNVCCHSAQLSTVQEMISSGQGVSLLPAMAKAADRSKDRIYRPLSVGKPQRTIVASWHKHRYQSPTMEQMLLELREVCAQYQPKEDPDEA